MTANTRFKQINEAIEAEALAQTTVLTWDFRDLMNTNVMFRSEWHYRPVGTENYFGVPEPDGMIRIGLQRILELGPDPNGTPPEAVMAYLKWLFDMAHNEQRTIENRVDPEPEPEPEQP